MQECYTDSQENRLESLEQSNQTLLKFEKLFLRKEYPDYLLIQHAKAMRISHQHDDWDSLMQLAKKSSEHKDTEAAVLTLESILSKRLQLKEQIVQRLRLLNPEDMQNIIVYWQQARDQLRIAIKQYLNQLPFLHDIDQQQQKRMQRFIHDLCKTLKRMPNTVSKTALPEFEKHCLQALNPQSTPHDEKESEPFLDSLLHLFKLSRKKDTTHQSPVFQPPTHNTINFQKTLDQTDQMLEVLFSDTPLHDIQQVTTYLSSELKIAYHLIAQLHQISHIKQGMILKNEVKQQHCDLMRRFQINDTFSQQLQKFQYAILLFKNTEWSHLTQHSAYEELSHIIPDLMMMKNIYEKKWIIYTKNIHSSHLSTLSEYQHSLSKQLTLKLQHASEHAEQLELRTNILLEQYHNEKQQLIQILNEPLQDIIAFTQFKNTMYAIGLIRYPALDHQSTLNDIEHLIDHQDLIISNGKTLYFANAEKRTLTPLPTTQHKKRYREIQEACQTEYRLVPETLYESIRLLTTWDQASTVESSQHTHLLKQNIEQAQNIPLHELKQWVEQEKIRLEDKIMTSKMMIEIKLNQKFMTIFEKFFQKSNKICHMDNLNQLTPGHPAIALLKKEHEQFTKHYKALNEHLDGFKQLTAKDLKHWNETFTQLGTQTQRSLTKINQIAKDTKRIQRRLNSELFTVFNKIKMDINIECKKRQKLGRQSDEPLKTLQQIQNKLRAFREDYIPASGMLTHAQRALSDLDYCEKLKDMLQAALQHNYMENLSDDERFKLTQFIRIHIFKPIQQFFNRLSETMKRPHQLCLVKIFEKPTLHSINQMFRLSKKINSLMITYQNDLYYFNAKSNTLRKISVNPDIKTQYGLVKMSSIEFTRRRSVTNPQFILVGNALYFCPANKREPILLSRKAADIHPILRDNTQRLSLHNIQRIQSIISQEFPIDCPELNNFNQLKAYLNTLTPIGTFGLMSLPKKDILFNKNLPTYSSVRLSLPVYVKETKFFVVIEEKLYYVNANHKRVIPVNPQKNGYHDIKQRCREKYHSIGYTTKTERQLSDTAASLISQTCQFKPEKNTLAHIHAVLKTQKPLFIQTIGASRTEKNLISLGIKSLRSLEEAESKMTNKM